MKYILVGFFAAVTLLATGIVGQHEGHHPEEAASASPKAPAAREAPAADVKGKMMAGKADVAKLVDQLVTGFAALENEKDPAALKTKLAEHGKLLKELQSKIQAESQMMEHMHGMMMDDRKNK